MKALNRIVPCLLLATVLSPTTGWTQAAAPAAAASAASAPNGDETQVVDAGTGIVFARPKSDVGNYKGDRVDFNTHIVVAATAPGAPNSAKVCLPRHASLRGTGQAQVQKKTADGKGTEQVTMVQFEVLKSDALDDTTGCKAAVRFGGPTASPRPGDTVLIAPEVLTDQAPNRYGWTFGTLAVPFKYHLRGDRGITGGVTLGGYTGYRWTWRATSLSVIGFVGGTKVDVPAPPKSSSTAGTTGSTGTTGTETDTGTDTSKDQVSGNTVSLAGFSYGLGLVANIKQAFQVGLVVGADRVSKNANYANNGKPWISLSLGYDFFN